MIVGRRLRLAMIINVLLLGVLSCVAIPAPGSVRRRTVTASGIVYVDSDRNGTKNGGETALPGVRLVAESNVHGAFTYETVEAEADGRAQVSATFTHFFNVHALTPCGYEATGRVVHDVADDGSEFSFGFAPLPTLGDDAVVQVVVWEDASGDGVRREGEAILSNAPVAYETRARGVWGPDRPTPTPSGASEMARATTDSAGWVTLDLGATCGEIRLVVLDPEQEGGSPLAEVETAYDLGVKTVAIGVDPPSSVSGR